MLPKSNTVRMEIEMQAFMFALIPQRWLP